MANRKTWKEKRRDIEGSLGLFAFTTAQKWLLGKKAADAEKTGERLGRTLYKLSRKHRERALSNLELAFPEMSLEERTALSKRIFEHYGRTTADFVRAKDRTKEQIDAMVTVEGVHHLDEAFAQGRGVLFITAHFGNWELMAQWLSFHYGNLTVIARDVRNTTLNQKVNEIRLASGTKVLPRGQAARQILESLRKNEMIGILPDQNEDEVYIPFFGKTAGTVLGPGVIHARTNSVVVPGWCAYEGPGKYRIIFDAPLEPEPGYEVKGEGLMRAIHTSLEAIIRRYPEQWLWFHDRWKSARRKGLL